MRVAFVSVNQKVREQIDLETSFFKQKCTIELGLLYLDANADWSPEDERRHFNMFDLALRGQDALVELECYDPDLLAISALSYYAEELAEFVGWARARLTSVILVGGPHVTAVEQAIFEEISPDYAVVGEGELSFRLLLNYIRGINVDLTSVPGLIWRENGVLRSNARQPINALDTLKWPTLAQVDPHEYSSYTSLMAFRVTHMPIITSRGCPYSCIYCHEIMGKKVRYRSPESVLEEIDYWHKTAGVNTFFIFDDIFNVHRRRLRVIFDGLIRRPGLRFAFPNGLRADLLDQEIADLLVDGGTFYAMVAVESGDASIQKHIEKRLDLDRTFDIIEHLGSQGIILGSFNIFGFPGETEADIQRTIAFSEATSGLTKANFFVLNPHKGTRAYDMAMAEGYKAATGTAQGYFNISNCSPTKHVSPERLNELREEAYRRFYLTPHRLDLVLSAKARNLTANERREYHQADYSYILRQFVNGGLDTLPSDVQWRLRNLLPDGPMSQY